MDQVLIKFCVTRCATYGGITIINTQSQVKTCTSWGLHELYIKRGLLVYWKFLVSTTTNRSGSSAFGVSAKARGQVGDVWRENKCEASNQEGH